LRLRFKAENYGVLQDDGTLKPSEIKTYDLAYVVMRFKPLPGWEVSSILITLQVAICDVSYLLVFYRMVLIENPSECWIDVSEVPHLHVVLRYPYGVWMYR